MDNDRNIYFSSWYTRAVYKYDSLFTNPAELIYQNPGGPADLYYDKLNYLLAVPVADSNLVDFIQTPVSVFDGFYTALPENIILYGNYPNPFNSKTSILFEIGSTSAVEVNIYDNLGRLIQTGYKEFYERGMQKVNLNTSDFDSGVYFYRISIEGSAVTGKMTLIK
jgi:hypothetical protein